MATIQQIQRGFATFVDMEVACAFEGWQRAVVAGCAGLMAANAHKLVEVYGTHPFVAALGVYDSESGNVDLDSLYNAFVPRLGAEKIPISIPKIGTIRIGRPEIDSLMRHIQEAR
jgi:hypothetical protein